MTLSEITLMSARPIPEPKLAAIRPDYEAGELSINEIARRHGVCRDTVMKYARKRTWARGGRTARGGLARVLPFRAGDPCPGLPSCPLRRQMLAKAEGALSRLVDRVHEAAGEEGLPDAKLLSLLLQAMGRAADLEAKHAARREAESESEERHDFAAYRRELARLFDALRAENGAAQGRPDDAPAASGEPA
jgi:hypothetical protein